MADALDNVITELTTLMAAMAGIDQAPEYPPEGVTPPMVVTYHTRATWTYSQGITYGLHTIYCDVLLARASLENDERAARPYIIRGLNTIAANVTLSGTCSHCVLQETLGPGPFPYAGQNLYGVRYICEVKIQHSVTVAA